MKKQKINASDTGLSTQNSPAKISNAHQQPSSSHKRVKAKDNAIIAQFDAQNEPIPCGEDALALGVLTDYISQSAHSEIVVVCFGTSAISGDALGPRVGSMLSQGYNTPVFVYGTEQAQINGKNMQDWIGFISAVHKDALFISVDASLGSNDAIGKIIIRNDGVCPSGVTGKRERFGHIGILGIVAQKQGDAIMQLLSVSPLYVDNLADKISILLNRALTCK